MGQLPRIIKGQISMPIARKITFHFESMKLLLSFFQKYRFITARVHGLT